MTDAPPLDPAAPAPIVRPALARAGAVAVAAAVWAAFFWRLLVAPGPDRLMLARSPAVLSALSARDAVLSGWLASGDLCMARPDAATLAYPPAIVSAVAHAAAGAGAYPFRSLEWEVMLHALIAIVGATLWLGARPAGTAAAVAGATAYAFGALGAGYATSRPDALAAMTWVPWGLWFARRAAASSALAWPLCAAACAGLAVLSGDLVLGAAAALLIGFALARARPRPTWSHAAAAALFAALAAPAVVAGMAAVPPWPESRGWASVAPGAAVLFLGALSPRPRRAFGIGVLAIAAALALDAAHVARDVIPAVALAAHAVLAAAACSGLQAAATAKGFRARHTIGRLAGGAAVAAAAAFAAVVVLAVFIRLGLPPIAALDAEANRLALMALSLAACAVVARWRAASPGAARGWGAAAAGIVLFETLSAQHFGGMDAVGDVAARVAGAVACSSVQSGAWLVAAGALALAAAAATADGVRHRAAVR